MTLAEQMDARKKQWESFNDWEANEVPLARDAASILADLGTIWNWLPPEVRSADPDPEKAGIAQMRAALAMVHDSA